MAQKGLFFSDDDDYDDKKGSFIPVTSHGGP
jgi:hypothetical protein